MKNSNIEWTDHTFSPWWGCTRVSPGCSHCYAADLGNRFGVQWGKGNPRRFSSEKVWSGPLAWNKAAQKIGRRIRVFCGSMCDWADDEVHPAWRTPLWDMIRVTTSIDWLMLTKRAENVPRMLPRDWNRGWGHVHLGFTAENQLQYDRRAAIMERVPAVYRFISCEPLLGPIDLGFGNWERRSAIHQVIAGGESGPHARPMNPAWPRALRDQCVAAGIPYLFKQWGEYSPGRIDIFGEHPDPLLHVFEFEDQKRVPMFKLGKKEAGRLLDGREWNEYPPLKGIPVC